MVAVSGQHHHRVFKVVDDGLEQFCAKCAVNDPVIDTERNGHNGCHGQFAVFTYNRFLDARTDCQNCAVGGLITASKLSIPNIPRLEIAKLPP